MNTTPSNPNQTEIEKAIALADQWRNQWTAQSWFNYLSEKHAEEILAAAKESVELRRAFSTTGDLLSAANVQVAQLHQKLAVLEKERDEFIPDGTAGFYGRLAAKKCNELNQLHSLAKDLAEALKYCGKVKQFHNQYCFCDTSDGSYCVGQEQCDKANKALLRAREAKLIE